jgi:hypothetical protein
MVLSELTSLIVAMSSVATPVVGVLGFLELHRKNNEMNATLNIVRKETNGMKTELVNEVRTASLAKGRFDQKADDRAGYA